MEAAFMLEPQHESALAHVGEASGTYISIREIPTRGMIDLRGLTGDRKFMSLAKNVLGIDLPKLPRTSHSFGEVKALWLSPDQWLILCAYSKAATLQAELSTALKDIHALAVDVSDMRSVIRLEGEGAREVLMKGGSLDFTDGALAPGYVRRMRFAEIAALVHIVEHNIIDLYVFRSYAQYAFDFLQKAARNGTQTGMK
jgi:sarcosine oxidase subunit gamma